MKEKEKRQHSSNDSLIIWDLPFARISDHLEASLEYCVHSTEHQLLCIRKINVQMVNINEKSNAFDWLVITCKWVDSVHNAKMVNFRRYDLNLAGKRGNCHFYCLRNSIVEFWAPTNQPERQHSRPIVTTTETGDNFPFYNLWLNHPNVQYQTVIYMAQHLE